MKNRSTFSNDLQLTEEVSTLFAPTSEDMYGNQQNRPRMLRAVITVPSGHQVPEISIHSFQRALLQPAS